MGQAWQVRLRIRELSGPQRGLSLRSRDATPAGLTSSPFVFPVLRACRHSEFEFIYLLLRIEPKTRGLEDVVSERTASTTGCTPSATGAT